MPATATTADAPAVTTAVPEGAPKLPTRISWGAVLAGGIAAVAVGVMLNVLGLAVGATSLDPARAGGSPSASTIGIAGGIWLMVANLIGLGIGGWVAARLSGTSDDTDGLLHGLSVWAVGFLISLLLLGNVVAGATGTVFRSASSVIGGTMQGAGQAVGQAAQAAAPDIAQAARTTDTDQLIARLQGALQSGGDPQAMTPDQRRSEITQILGTRIRQGEFRGDQRDRLAQLVAAETGVPPEQANERIGQVETQAREAAARAETQAREAAQTAAEAAATTAYWLFAAMILGAAAAVLGARLGTRRAVAVRQYG
jgi:hypothetical protein